MISICGEVEVMAQDRLDLMLQSCLIGSRCLEITITKNIIGQISDTKGLLPRNLPRYLLLNGIIAPHSLPYITLSNGQCSIWRQLLDTLPRPIHSGFEHPCCYPRLVEIMALHSVAHSLPRSSARLSVLGAVYVVIRPVERIH